MADPTAAAAPTNTACAALPSSTILLSRPTYIALLTIPPLILALTLSVVILLYLRHRHRQRRTRAWGRKSMFANASKRVDDSYSLRYKGVWQSEVPENPEMGSEEPVEMGIGRQCWEIAGKEVVASVQPAVRGGWRGSLGWRA